MHYIAELQKELSIDTDKLTNSVKEAVKSDNVNTDLMSVYIDEQGELKTIGPKLTRKRKTNYIRAKALFYCFIIFN